MEARWPEPPSSAASILVTGGAGFIGSHLLEQIIGRFPGLRVTCLDALTYAGSRLNIEPFLNAENFRFIQADLRDRAQVDEAVREAQPDWVFHLAAETHVDRSIHQPSEAALTNVVGSLNLMDSCRSAWGSHAAESKRFIQVSTDEVFGSLTEGKFSEASSYDPSSPYSASKAGADHFAFAFCRTFDFPAIVTWCTNNYGPRQHPEKLIPLMTLNALSGKPLPIYGDGLHARDWLFAADHTEGLWRAACLGRVGQGYCFGGSTELTNLQVVDAIIKNVATAAGRSEDEVRSQIVHVADRPGHDRRYALDWAKAQTELEWAPRTPFEKGFAATIRWYLDNPQWAAAVGGSRFEEWLNVNYGSRGREASR